MVEREWSTCQHHALVLQSWCLCQSRRYHYPLSHLRRQHISLSACEVPKVYSNHSPWDLLHNTTGMVLECPMCNCFSLVLNFCKMRWVVRKCWEAHHQSYTMRGHAHLQMDEYGVDTQEPTPMDLQLGQDSHIYRCVVCDGHWRSISQDSKSNTSHSLMKMSLIPDMFRSASFLVRLTLTLLTAIHSLFLMMTITTTIYTTTLTPSQQFFCCKTIVWVSGESQTINSSLTCWLRVRHKMLINPYILA